MEPFLVSLTTPSWWVGVVIVGIIINVISSYLKNPIDKILSAISGSRRERNKRKLNERNELISTLRDDADLLILFAMSENRYRIRSVGFLLISFAAFSGSTLLIGITDTGSITGLIFAMLIALAGLHDHSEAIRVYAIVKDSNDKYKEISA
ncbi:hypothetical protein [Moritella viscosa]|uniref:ATP-dependent DNA helicase recG n=1 Tax=Moritella viscosa TaxID=80854 RepID=A0A1K9Z2J5_9GAMM|nr:hypothetical protein [Moritella viscosa]SGY87688.1 ATP-dependent DNA helicase recG [Moritella viscosa]